jgi:PilZ domain
MKTPAMPRAHALMNHSMEDQRRAPRTPVCMSAIVSTVPDTFEQPALVRDMSESGLFFYCKFEPALGSEISVRFNTVEEGETERVLVRGNVVRIVRYPGAATGVGIVLAKDRPHM